jgi:hypothetical protein
VMEQRLGHDFGAVRIHADADAAAAAATIQARAYTYGSHVVMGAGQYQPHTRSGQALLTHELTHVIQQSGSAGTRPPVTISDPHDPAERQAAENVPAARQASNVVGVARPTIARQPAGGGDRPLVPVLDPADPRLRGVMERIAGEDSNTDQDPACMAPARESPPWMPARRDRSPVELGAGTRARPKLKAPDGPAGAQCRGACGPDCPDSCRSVGTYVERFEVGDCGYLVEFPNVLLCGTHEGCRIHDACFDAAVANGETELGGPRHVSCNEQALTRYGPVRTTSWARGGGPYDDWWYFTDQPVVRKSWRIHPPPGPSAPAQ